jgi:hypothetical protein
MSVLFESVLRHAHFGAIDREPSSIIELRESGCHCPYGISTLLKKRIVEFKEVDRNRKIGLTGSSGEETMFDQDGGEWAARTCGEVNCLIV